MSANRKLTIGADYDFVWFPPSGVYTLQSLTLTVYWPSGTLTYSLDDARLIDDEPAEDRVAAVSADRKRLTVAWGATAPVSVLRVPEPAMYVDVGRASIPVGIVRIEEATAPDESIPDFGTGYVDLAEALPHGIGSATNDARLRFSARYGQISFGGIGTTPRRAVRWTVGYDPSGPTAPSPAAAGIIDSGILVICRHPFDTHLTDAGVHAFWPSIGPVPMGWAGWASAREAAGLDLEGRIGAVIPRDKHVDMVDGGQFVRLHALLTARQILLGRMVQGIGVTSALDILLAEIEAEQARMFARLADIDLNDDGLVDDGETDTAAQGSGTAGGATWTDPSIVAFASDDAPFEKTRCRVSDER